MLEALNQKAALCGFFFSPVHAADLPELCDIRVEAMRDSLLRLGRFDVTRARARLADQFEPNHTFWIGDRAGLLVLNEDLGRIKLAHLYLRLREQGKGLGSQVLQAITDWADERQQAIALIALVGSRANSLYQRHGFNESNRDAIDVYYERPPVLLSSRSS